MRTVVCIDIDVDAAVNDPALIGQSVEAFVSALNSAPGVTVVLRDATPDPAGRPSGSDGNTEAQS